MSQPARKLISVVTPAYNEEQNILDCYNAVRGVFESRLPGYDYEHIFCDNASTDRTVEILKGIAATDSRVKVIVNSRNFGPFRSLFNGVLSTRGDAVVVMVPADLQDPPELIPDLVSHWERGCEVVNGIRKNREESRLMSFIRRSYYRLVSRTANITIPLNAGEFQLVDRVVIEALRKYDDYYPYIRGMIADCGFRSAAVEYTWRARRKGLSKNHLLSLIDQGLNGLISFTNLPMRLCIFSGLLISGASLLYALFNVVVHLLYFREFAAPGIPTLITAVFFFGGVQMLALGMIGEYISAIHFQVRKRPLVTERERINF